MSASAIPALAPARPWIAALLWLLFLGPFFFGSYGFANWLASQRAGVAAIAYDWERQIPFAAWTIVPYWSIDLLYGVSLLLCATRAELDVHVRRLLGAQLICVPCFILFPLRFSFPRPAADGVFGLMFDVLAGFDKPFNQAPSLHIALLIILWVLYLRHARGMWRWILHVWFLLIGVSVLTTYQHHFIDLPTGLWVGWLCVWLFPDDRPSLLVAAAPSADPRRRTLAAYYAAAAVASGTIALYLGGWGLWLLWLSGSLLLVASIYAFFDETAFQKGPDGSMSVATRWLMAPYLLGAWLNSRWWTRSTANVDAVTPGLLLGRLPTRKERDAQGIRAIVDLTAELPCAANGIRYVSVPQLDLVLPSIAQLERSVHAIEASIGSGPVLVCCALGFSRSATAVAAWLIASGRAISPADAIEQVRRVRPTVVLGAAHIGVLEPFALRYSKSPG